MLRDALRAAQGGGRRKQTWREQFRPIVSEVVAEQKGDGKAARRVLRVRLREYFQSITAYRVYLSEVRVALRLWPETPPIRIERKRRRSPDVPGQRLLALQGRAVDHGSTDLRALGVEPIEDLVPRPLVPSPLCPPLFDDEQT